MTGTGAAVTEIANQAATPLSSELMARAKIAKMKIIDVKKARKAIKALREKLVKTDEEQWSDMITGAIAAEFNIYHYINAVGFYAALAEAGADQEFTVKLAELLKASGMVPDDLPYTEEDVAAKYGAEEE